MKASELKKHILEANPESQFFTQETMNFFGDTMKNYGVRNATVTDTDGNTVAVWELYRKKPVKHGIQDSTYFCRETFKRVFTKR